MLGNGFWIRYSQPAVLIVNSNIVIPASELEFTFVRSSGAGGQNVNKVNSKAQLRWNLWHSGALPSGVRERFLHRFASRLTTEGDLIIMSDRHRDQARNRDDCLEKLKELLLLVAEPPKKRKKTRPTRGAVERRHREKSRQGEKKRNRGGRGWD